MKKHARNAIQCEIYKNPSITWLEKAWIELEKRANGNFFLSWLWIGTWLNTFEREFYVVEARDEHRTVGLGIIMQSRQYLWGVPLKKRYYLHRTGVEKFDQIWIEYNDFLIDRHYGNNIRQRMSRHILFSLTKNNAIVIGASNENDFSHIEDLGLTKRALWHTKNYALDLDRLRANNQHLVNFLSRNSRYQILRSMRKYQQQYGDIRIIKADSVNSAKQMFTIAKPLHLARWNKVSQQSGFTNPFFVNFHHKLIENGIQSGNIELYHIKAGEHSISVMYNFKYKNNIYFYLSAINYANPSSQFKPGLVSHFLLINRAYAEQVALYDFMGGYARYKRTFTNIEGELSVNLYQPTSIGVTLGNLFRDSKSKVMQKRRKKFCEEAMITS